MPYTKCTAFLDCCSSPENELSNLLRAIMLAVSRGGPQCRVGRMPGGQSRPAARLGQDKASATQRRPSRNSVRPTRPAVSGSPTGRPDTTIRAAQRQSSEPQSRMGTGARVSPLARWGRSHGLPSTPGGRAASSGGPAVGTRSSASDDVRRSISAVSGPQGSEQRKSQPALTKSPVERNRGGHARARGARPGGADLAGGPASRRRSRPGPASTAAREKRTAGRGGSRPSAGFTAAHLRRTRWAY